MKHGVIDYTSGTAHHVTKLSVFRI